MTNRGPSSSGSRGKRRGPYLKNLALETVEIVDDIHNIINKRVVEHVEVRYALLFIN